ncbi:MAG: HIT family protein [Chthoniobacterales bacterium]
MSFPKQHIESLWSPWRVEYFDAEYKASRDFLLEAAEATDDAEHLVVCRRATAFLIMNKYPYASGHLMAVPNRKVCEMRDLGEKEQIDIWKLCVRAQDILRDVVRAQGFNVGLNVGRAGGAGVQDHMHWHIVPRWEGDSNFMAVVGNTRILPQGLVPLYEKLVTAERALPQEY